MESMVPIIIIVAMKIDLDIMTEIGIPKNIMHAERQEKKMARYQQ